MERSSSGQTPHLRGVFELAERYDAFFLDLWGVIHNGFRAYDGVVECLDELKSRGKKACLVSNSPRRNASLAAMMSEFGVTPDKYTCIISSGELTNHFIRTAQGDYAAIRGPYYYDFWSESPVCTMQGLEGFARTEDLERASFILGGLLDSDRYNDLSDYEAVLRKGAALGLPLVCANPDFSVYHGESLQICPGALARRYEELGGKALWAGKPFPEIYRHALGLVGSPDKAKVVAIGDSLHTDIAGARGFGIDSALNLIGLHREEVESNGRLAPDKLEKLLASSPCRPDYTLDAFRWGI